MTLQPSQRGFTDACTFMEIILQPPLPPPAASAIQPTGRRYLTYLCPCSRAVDVMPSHCEMRSILILLDARARAGVSPASTSPDANKTICDSRRGQRER